ncbi:MAG: YqaJ viral recombinase family protein [Lachnospiraceae bacterium]|nr:YqaJ viral recombinase family protein [Lachnospiraceae bacterium]MDE7176335.1 YqaJ viral recombinase family protein [Lachnospiraceae bacterium]
MYEKISIKGMSQLEWLQLRKTGIGGSDAGAICGLNPYSSAMKVFRDKTGGVVEEQDSEAIRIGHDLEQYVAERFMEATGLKVRRSNYMYRSKEHPFMIADVDRLIIGEDAGLECKTASAYNADKWDDGNIPLHYMMQCYHYMAVTGKRVWYIAAVILGREFVYRRLEWDDAIISSLIAMEKDFWHNHVLMGKIPPPDGSKACDEVIAQYFGTAKASAVIKLSGFDAKLGRRREILQKIAELETEKKQIEQEVKLVMGEHELARSESYSVSWGNVDSTRLDTKRIKEERPEIYANYTTVSHSRRFEVKVA